MLDLNQSDAIVTELNSGSWVCFARSALLMYIVLFFGANFAFALLARAFNICMPFLRRFMLALSN